jgi:cell division protease FtsH
LGLCLPPQSATLATELAAKLPPAALASLLSAALAASPAVAAPDFVPPPTDFATPAQQQRATPSSLDFQGSANLAAPDVKASGEYTLPEGTQWRYSDFIVAVEKGKVSLQEQGDSGEAGEVCVRESLRMAVKP